MTRTESDYDKGSRGPGVLLWETFRLSVASQLARDQVEEGLDLAPTVTPVVTGVVKVGDRFRVLPLACPLSAAGGPWSSESG